MQFAGLLVMPSRLPLIPALLMVMAGLPAQTTRLKPSTIEGDVSAGQNRVYTVKLNANRYLVAVVRQESPAVGIELHAPDGKSMLQIDTRDFPGKPTKVRWVSDVKGEYQLSVSVLWRRATFDPFGMQHGYGDGTEVEGFGALAQRQGAKAVIATLWSVADESTSRLMEEFYRVPFGLQNTAT